MSNERSAPLGRLWATPGDLPHQHAISREFALDSGMPDPDQYPSWPNYPDERNLPVAFEARARWKLRLAKLQEKTHISVKKNPHTEKTHKENAQPETGVCGGCGEPLPPSLGKPRLYHSGACRMKYVRKQGK